MNNIPLFLGLNHDYDEKFIFSVCCTNFCFKC